MNLAPRKINSTAVLKNLPADRQAELLEHYESHKGADTAEWLAKEGIKAKPTMLSRWYSWYVTKRNFEELESNIVDQLLLLRRQNPKITREDLDELGEFLFNAIAITRKDLKTWLELQKHKDQKAKTAKVIQDTGLTPEEQEQRMKEIFGI
jgi:hypothetical protein